MKKWRLKKPQGSPKGWVPDPDGVLANFRTFMISNHGFFRQRRASLVAGRAEFLPAPHLPPALKFGSNFFVSSVLEQKNTPSDGVFFYTNNIFC